MDCQWLGRERERETERETERKPRAASAGRLDRQRVLSKAPISDLTVQGVPQQVGGISGDGWVGVETRTRRGDGHQSLNSNCLGRSGRDVARPDTWNRGESCGTNAGMRQTASVCCQLRNSETG